MMMLDTSSAHTATALLQGKAGSQHATRALALPGACRLFRAEARQHAGR